MIRIEEAWLQCVDIGTLGVTSAFPAWTFVRP